MPASKLTRLAAGGAVVLSTIGVLAATSPAYIPVGSDFRISNVGADGDDTRDAISPSVAYNRLANEYLVVWEADGLTTNGEQEIFGQRLSLTGAELGSDFRISQVGADGDFARGAFEPTVAFNSRENEYLVTWRADGLATNEEWEIFGQRLSAAGTELGSDFRISNVGVDGDPTRAAFFSSVAYNPVQNEYLVAWRGEGLATAEENEIFGQRVSFAGNELGADFRISQVGADGDQTRDAGPPSVGYNPAADEYLVAWEADGLATNNEVEIFGQRLHAAGVELGSDFRISNAGVDTDASRRALAPSVTSGSAAGEYLVVWHADGLATDEEYETFGQRVSAVGAELGSDFRISSVGRDGDPDRAGISPSAAYNSSANEYLVTWEGDGLATATEYEIFGQRLSLTGAELGSDFRISHTGQDGDRIRDAHNPSVAYSPVADEHLVAWSGDGLATEGETEIIGRRIAVPASAPPSQPAAIAPVAPSPRCKPGFKLKKVKTKSGKRKRKCVRKGKPKSK